MRVKTAEGEEEERMKNVARRNGFDPPCWTFLFSGNFRPCFIPQRRRDHIPLASFTPMHCASRTALSPLSSTRDDVIPTSSTPDGVVRDQFGTLHTRLHAVREQCDAPSLPDETARWPAHDLLAGHSPYMQGTRSPHQG